MSQICFSVILVATSAARQNRQSPNSWSLGDKEPEAQIHGWMTLSKYSVLVCLYSLLFKMHYM